LISTSTAAMAQQPRGDDARREPQEVAEKTPPPPTPLVLVAGLAPEDVLRRAAMSCRTSEVHQRALAFYLHEIDERRLFLDLGYSSTWHLATSLLDISVPLARELVAVGRELLGLPQIDEAFRAGRISWTIVRILRRFVTPETEAEWLGEAQREGMSSRRLAEEAVGLEKGSRPRKDRYGLPVPRLKIVASVDPVVHEMFETARRKLQDEGGVAVTNPELVAFLCERYLREQGQGASESSHSLYRLVLHRSLETGETLLETDDSLVRVDPAQADAIRCDADVVNLESDTAGDRDPARVLLDRKTPAWMRKKVLARDGHRCRCCGRRGRLTVHHKEFRSEGGPTRLSNLLSVCLLCHGLIHAGLLRIEGEDVASARFIDARGRALYRRLGDEASGPHLAVEIRDGVQAKESHCAGASRTVASPENFPDDATRVAGTAPEAKGAPAGERKVTRGRSSRPGLLPERAPAAWWKDNSFLFSWNERRQVFELDRKALEEGGIPVSPFTGQIPVPPAPPYAGDEPDSPLLQHLVGLDRVRSFLDTEIRSTRILERPLDPLLLTGPPGTGKTSVVNAVARDLGVRLQRVNGPALRTPSVLVSWLAAACAHDLLFIDEVHALPRSSCEMIYEALDRGTISIPVAVGSLVHRIELVLEPLSFACATTHLGELPEALVSRFGGGHLEVDFYSEEEVAAIVRREAERTVVELGVATRVADEPVSPCGESERDVQPVRPRHADPPVTDRAVRILTRASRGVPRRALQLLRRAGKVALARGQAQIGAGAVVRALRDLGLDAKGLGHIDRKLLSILGAARRPLSLGRLAALAGVPSETLRDVHEPPLLREGWIQVTPRGRALLRE